MQINLFIIISKNDLTTLSNNYLRQIFGEHTYHIYTRIFMYIYKYTCIYMYNLFNGKKQQPFQ